MPPTTARPYHPQQSSGSGERFINSDAPQPTQPPVLPPITVTVIPDFTFDTTTPIPNNAPVSLPQTTTSMPSVTVTFVPDVILQNMTGPPQTLNYTPLTTPMTNQPMYNPYATTPIPPSSAESLSQGQCLPAICRPSCQPNCIRAMIVLGLLSQPEMSSQSSQQPAIPASTPAPPIQTQTPLPLPPITTPRAPQLETLLAFTYSPQTSPPLQPVQPQQQVLEIPIYLCVGSPLFSCTKQNTTLAINPANYSDFNINSSQPTYVNLLTSIPQNPQNISQAPIYLYPGKPPAGAMITITQTQELKHPDNIPPESYDGFLKSNNLTGVMSELGLDYETSKENQNYLTLTPQNQSETIAPSQNITNDGVQKIHQPESIEIPNIDNQQSTAQSENNQEVFEHHYSTPQRDPSKPDSDRIVVPRYPSPATNSSAIDSNVPFADVAEPLAYPGQNPAKDTPEPNQVVCPKACMSHNCQEECLQSLICPPSCQKQNCHPDCLVLQSVNDVNNVNSNNVNNNNNNNDLNMNELPPPVPVYAWPSTCIPPCMPACQKQCIDSFTVSVNYQLVPNAPEVPEVPNVFNVPTLAPAPVQVPQPPLVQQPPTIQQPPTTIPPSLPEQPQCIEPCQPLCEKTCIDMYSIQITVTDNQLDCVEACKPSGCSPDCIRQFSSPQPPTLPSLLPEVNAYPKLIIVKLQG